MNVRRHWILAGLVMAGAIAAGVALVGADKRDRHVLSKAEGVWRSRGYGWIWSIEDGKVSTFDHTASFCTKRRGPNDVPPDVGSRIRLSQDARTFRIAVSDPSYFFTFDKISSLPDACTREPETDSVTVFQMVAETFSQHYAFFGPRKIDWPALVSRYGKQVSSDSDDEELFEILSTLIAPIDDAHVGLEGLIDGDRRSYEPESRARPVPALARERQDRIGHWTTGIGTKLVTGRVHRAGEGKVRYGLIGDDVGYIHVRSTGLDLADAADGGMDDARDLFRHTKALVIDLTGNGGGLDWAARRFASLFARERVVGYYKYAGDARGEAPQAVYIEASDNPLYEGPIYLITDRGTISAAEILAMCLRALPNVTHIGEATKGSLSDILEKELPNGWSLNLSNEVYLDAEGKAWEGKGIPPHVEFVVHNEDSAPGDPLEAARAMINFVLSQNRKS